MGAWLDHTAESAGLQQADALTSTRTRDKRSTLKAPSLLLNHDVLYSSASMFGNGPTNHFRADSIHEAAAKMKTASTITDA